MGVTSLLHGLSTKDPVQIKLAVSKGRPTPAEIVQFRYQVGPNLGALFVQEKWIDSSLFKEGTDTGGSELAALESWGRKPNLDELKARWEDHWKNFVTDEDWKLMQSRGVTCVRLPIGFWTLPNPKSHTASTPFEKYAKVYEDSWKHVTEFIFKPAADHGISVLVDVHALPGGANGDEHSGTSTGKAELWEHHKYREQAIRIYVDAVKACEGHANVFGVELVNEAPWGESKLKGFYLDAASKLREEKAGACLPLIISDGWDYGSWVAEVKHFDKKAGGPTGFIIDTHVYRTFSDSDKAKGAQEHIDAASNAVQFDEDVDAIVGEWSCVLDEQSWNNFNGDRQDAEVQYGKNQLANFSQLAGNFFWTYKFGQGVGGAWDWKNMSEKGVFLPRIDPNRGDCDSALKTALDQHKQYWENQDSKQDWEHWRFEDGFKDGWEDAQAFAEYQGSRLGRIAAWKYARLQQHVKAKGKSDKTWVYSQAFVQGVRARTNA